MKKTGLGIIIASLAFTLFAGFVFSARPKQAEALIRSFGGRVKSTTISGVTCAGIGPITLSPAGFFAPTPYFIAAGLSPRGGGPPNAGGQILGLYIGTLTPGGCYTDSVPPVPYPTFPVYYQYGTSRQ